MIKNVLIWLVYILIFTGCSANKLNVNLVKENSILTKVSDGFSFTEGPSSDADGNVYFTDQPNDKIFIWDWKSNSIAQFSNNTGRANGTFFDQKNQLLTCSDLNGEIWRFNANGEKESIIVSNVNGKRLNGPNDLWIDDRGGIYFTDPLYQRDYWENFQQDIKAKNLYYRNISGDIKTLDTFTQPNGIIGSNKLNKLFVSDIDAGLTYQYDIIGNGEISNKKIFCNLGSDGMTLDQHGNLYLTGNGVTVYNPKGLKILHIPIAEKWTSNVTFGGKDRKTLFITSSESVYILEMNVKGMY